MSFVIFSPTLAGGLCEDLCAIAYGRKIDFVGSFIAESTSCFFRYHPKFDFYSFWIVNES